MGRGLSIAEFNGNLAKTILVGEAAEPIAWSSHDDFHYDPKKPLPKLGVFPDGFFTLMGDARVLWVPSIRSEETIRALIERDSAKPTKLVAEKEVK